MSVTDDYMHFSDFGKIGRTFFITAVTVYKALYIAEINSFLRVLSSNKFVKMHIFLSNIS